MVIAASDGLPNRLKPTGPGFESPVILWGINFLVLFPFIFCSDIAIVLDS